MFLFIELIRYKRMYSLFLFCSNGLFASVFFLRLEAALPVLAACGGGFDD